MPQQRRGLGHQLVARAELLFHRRGDSVKVEQSPVGCGQQSLAQFGFGLLAPIEHGDQLVDKLVLGAKGFVDERKRTFLWHGLISLPGGRVSYRKKALTARGDLVNRGQGFSAGRDKCVDVVLLVGQ